VIPDPGLIEPFWRSATMRGESLFFVDRGDGVATATLLFQHVERVSLASATGEIVYEAGREYSVDSAAGIVSRTPASRIPFATLEELYPAADPFVLIADGDEFHRRQVAATYAHPHRTWRGYVPGLASTQLPRTIQRLSSSQPLTVCITGDSISEGYNASGFTGAPPHQPPYGELVAFGLERASGSPVTLHNLASAGWTSDDGVVDVERVADPCPDLVIVAYGMNDAGYAEALEFAANISGIMAGVLATSPNTEFVLVSPMLPNSRWAYPVMERFAAYRDALATLCGKGAALADVTSVWTDLLARKSVHDLTGNGINHPNDFGHRVYAQVILALLIGGARPY
jgi:lysophospholipase L1-like esterase